MVIETRPEKQFTVTDYQLFAGTYSTREEAEQACQLYGGIHPSMRYVIYTKKNSRPLSVVPLDGTEHNIEDVPNIVEVK